MAGLSDWDVADLTLAAQVADDGRLDPRWTVDTATDIVWALMSPDLLDRLLHQRDWTREQFAEAFTALLTSTLVETGVEGPTHPS